MRFFIFAYTTLMASQLFSCNSAADKRDTLANGKSGSLTGSSKRTFSFGFNGDAGMGLADASSSAPSPELKSVRINTKCLKSPGLYAAYTKAASGLSYKEEMMACDGSYIDMVTFSISGQDYTIQKKVNGDGYDAPSGTSVTGSGQSLSMVVTTAAINALIKNVVLDKPGVVIPAVVLPKSLYNVSIQVVSGQALLANSNSISVALQGEDGVFTVQCTTGCSVSLDGLTSSTTSAAVPVVIRKPNIISGDYSLTATASDGSTSTVTVGVTVNQGAATVLANTEANNAEQCFDAQGQAVSCVNTGASNEGGVLADVGVNGAATSGGAAPAQPSNPPPPELPTNVVATPPISSSENSCTTSVSQGGVNNLCDVELVTDTCGSLRPKYNKAPIACNSPAPSCKCERPSGMVETCSAYIYRRGAKVYYTISYSECNYGYELLNAAPPIESLTDIDKLPASVTLEQILKYYVYGAMCGCKVAPQPGLIDQEFQRNYAGEVPILGR